MGEQEALWQPAAVVLELEVQRQTRVTQEQPVAQVLVVWAAMVESVPPAALVAAEVLIAAPITLDLAAIQAVLVFLVEESVETLLAPAATGAEPVALQAGGAEVER